MESERLLNLKVFEVYTDGACKSNPGKGGWACLIRPFDSNQKIVLYGAVDNTTNNRMEMTAVLNALNYISFEYGDSVAITLYTDSKYIEQSINNGWLDKWINNSFKGIKNVDLWVKLYSWINKINVNFIWVKGHSGSIYNEEVDLYASRVCNTKEVFTTKIISE